MHVSTTWPAAHFSNRSEASTIPHLLVASEFHGKNAPNVSLEDTTASTGQHAIYQDGTWIAVDEGYEAARNDNHGYDDSGSEELYYRLLVKRFKGLRTTLKQPGLHKLAQKSIDGADQLPSVKPPLNRHEWLYILDREYPRPAQISQLDEKNIKRGLEYCVHAMDRFNTISSQKSCWIWTLLALSSDIGTLDSRKMSHIRDLGNKAGQLSIDLHQGTESRNFASDNDLVYAHQGLGGSQDDIDANEPALYDANGEKKNLGTESFQPGTNEYKDTTIEDTVSENVSDAQDGMQLQAIVPAVSECPVGNEESTDINTNRSALERARARLLAQLGDNLVQAGIPTAAHNIESTPLGRSEQLDQGLNDSGHELRVRAIPSRAEAERQRQMMRIRSSTTEIPSKVDSLYSESSSAVPTVTENQVLCAVDLNTRVTIDMILTVVAECYGQRDLLRYRRPW